MLETSLGKKQSQNDDTENPTSDLRKNTQIFPLSDEHH